MLEVHLFLVLTEGDELTQPLVWVGHVRLKLCVELLEEATYLHCVVHHW